MDSREDVRRFWVLCAMVAFMQDKVKWPYWVTPECPRVVIPENRESYKVPLGVEEEADMISRRWDGYLSASYRINEMTVHVDTFTMAVNTQTALDGYYEIGLGLLFLGDDPEFRREGRGIVYYWHTYRRGEL